MENPVAETPPNPVVAQFRSLIADIKKSYVDINHTYVKDDDRQNVENVMTHVIHTLDNIYISLLNVIQANGEIPTNVNEDIKLLYFAFEKYGIFPALRADPSLKDDLMYYAEQDLRIYPYTLNPSLINAHISNHTPVNSVIIPNRKVDGSQDTS
ncbi:hypothetical protein EBR66_03430 [bacterium]|nr:hypothetical protein [bacterium]